MYNESDVLRKIKRSCLKNVFWTIFALVFWCIFFIGGLYIDTDDVTKWFALIVGGIGIVYCLSGLVKKIAPVFNIESLDIFKEVKSIKELTEIINMTYTNNIYEDKEVIISKDYLIPKSFFEGTTKISNIIWVYEYDHDKYTMFGKQARLRVLNIYSFNTVTSIPYNVKEESKLRSAMYELKRINPNIITGYNSQNKEKYTKIIEKGKIENTTIECKVCGKEIPYNENGTCEECHKKIMDRLKKKEEPKERDNIVNNTFEKKDEDKMDIKFCTNCGKEIKPEWKFCNYCGHKND